MADQWTPVQETAPAPVTAGWTPVVENKGPGMMSRFIAGTGIPDTYAALTKDRPQDEEQLNPMAPGLDRTIRNTWDVLKGIAKASGNHILAADDFEKKGDYISAIGHTLYAFPGLGEMGYQTANRFQEGDIAGGLGGLVAIFGPKIAGDLAPRVAPSAVKATEAVKAAATGAAGGIVNAAKAGELYPKGYSRFFPGVVAHQLGFPQVAALLEGGALAAPTLKAGMRGAKASLADLANARQLKSLVEEGQRAPAVSPDVMSQFFEPDEIAGSTPPPNSEARVSPVPASAPAAPSEPTVNLNQLAEFSTSDLAAAVKRMADRRAASKAPPMADGLPIEGPSPANVPITPGGQSTPLPVSPEVSLPTRQGPGTLADLANPKSLIEEGLKARRNTLRDVKLNKVMDQLSKHGFEGNDLDLISPRQWYAVAQASGIEDLTAPQIAELKKRFKDSK